MCKLTLFEFYISVSGFPFLSAGKPTPKSRGYFLKLYTFLGGLSSQPPGYGDMNVTILWVLISGKHV